MSIEISCQDGDIRLGWHGRSLLLREPSPWLVNECRKPSSESVLIMIADEMAELTTPSIPASFVERVLRRQSVVAAAA